MIPIVHAIAHVAPLFIGVPFLCFSASNSQQASNETTLTSSGAASPNISGTATVATTGSIGVGSGGKYQEQGALDLSGASDVGGTVGSISAGGGSSVIIGDPNASSTISQLAQQFASTVQNVAGAGVQAVAQEAGVQQPGTISYARLGVIAAVIGAIIVVLSFMRGGQRT